jgi:hypothetical protein
MTVMPKKEPFDALSICDDSRAVVACAGGIACIGSTATSCIDSKHR